MFLRQITYKSNNRYSNQTRGQTRQTLMNLLSLLFVFNFFQSKYLQEYKEKTFVRTRNLLNLTPKRQLQSQSILCIAPSGLVQKSMIFFILSLIALLNVEKRVSLNLNDVINLKLSFLISRIFQSQTAICF